MAKKAYDKASRSNDARRQLQEAENRFAALEASLVDALVVLDERLKIMHVNTTFEKMFGWNHEELMGAELIFISKSDRARISRRLTAVLRGKSLQVELSTVTRDGTQIPTLMSGESFLDADGNVGGICLVLRNENHVRKLEKALTLSPSDLREFLQEESAELEFSDKKVKADILKRIEAGGPEGTTADTLDKLLAHKGIALAIFDLKGREQRVNWRFASLLGYKPEEMVDAIYLRELLPEKWQERLSASKEDLPKQGSFRNHEVEFYHKKGKAVWLMLSGGVLDYREDGNHRIFINAVDISHRKKREEELVEANEHLLARNNEMEGLLRERKRQTDELDEISHRQEKSIKKANEAMRMLIADFSDQKRDLEERIGENFRLTIYPLIEDLRSLGLSRAHEQLLDTLDFSIRHITSYFGVNLATSDVRLTDREIQICNMIREGKSSREIADATKLSYQTVIVHRKNIRKKLGIKKSKQNLTTYLQQTMSGQLIPRA